MSEPSADGQQHVDTEQQLAELVSAAQDQGLNMTACALDVSDLDSMTATLGALGRFDVLVNSAGMARHGPAADTKAADFDAVMAVNLRGAYFLSQQIANQMISAGTGGSIINISSQMAHVGGIERSVYCASKSAVEGFTKAMAIELAGEKIRVNAINPVAGETGMLHLFMGEDTPEKRAQFISSIPLGRLSLPEDMANAALFLCSDEAEMITGLCMEVDGGRCI